MHALQSPDGSRLSDFITTAMLELGDKMGFLSRKVQDSARLCQYHLSDPGKTIPQKTEYISLPIIGIDNRTQFIKLMNVFMALSGSRHEPETRR
jgi:hypothetical protein